MIVAIASKPSSVPVEQRRGAPAWISSVPDHWIIDRLRWTVTSCQNGIWGDEPDGVNDIPCVRVADFDRKAFKVAQSIPTVRAVTASERSGRTLQRGDLLLEKSGGGELQPVGVVVLYDHAEAAVCSNFVARMRVASGFDPRFLTYVHANLYAGRVNTRSIKQTTGIQNLDSMAYLDERAAWPPLPEQRAIAAWLDDRTKRIDELVAAKRRLIDLLAEQRTALITKAVTKGLNPNAPMKPSGIDWLGDVPRHWEVKPLKYAVTFQRGHDLPTEERIEGEVPVITSAGPSAWHDRAMAHGPGIVTGRYGTIGVFHLVRGPYWPLNTTLYSINLHANNPDFLRHMLHTLKAVFLLNAAKSAVPGVDRNDLHPTPVVVPPRPEQDQIADHLAGIEQRISVLTSAASTAIARLEEYRQSLITAAVTGKIDVRRGA